MELVLFELDAGCYAFPAGSVVKVLEPLTVTPLPYAPPELEGLVNVGGVVMVKLDLRTLLGLPSRASADEGNLLIVNGRHDTVVVQVDRVLNKAEVDDDSLRLHDADGVSLVRGEFLRDGALALLLDESLLGLDGVEPQGVPADGGGLLGQLATLEADTTERVASMPVLAVSDGGESYAFHMHDVHEIVERGPLTDLPGVDAAVEGLMQLRGDALLVLSLARLLGQRRDGNASHVIVVAPGGLRFGISVSDIVGMENHGADSLQALAVGDSQLEGYLPGTGLRAGRMTGLLSLAGLLSPALLESCGRYLERQAGGALALQAPPESVRRLLAFRVGAERCAIALASVDRIEDYSGGVSLPDDTSAFPAILQIQGELAAVADLRKLLGTPGAQPLPSAGRAYIVTRIGDASWALLADRIDGVIEIAESDITPVRTRQSDYLPEVGQLKGELVSLLSLAPLAGMNH